MNSFAPKFSLSGFKMPDRVFSHQGPAAHRQSVQPKHGFTMRNKEEKWHKFGFDFSGHNTTSGPYATTRSSAVDLSTQRIEIQSPQQNNKKEWRSSMQEIDNAPINRKLTLFSLPQYQTGNLQRKFRPGGVSIKNFESKVANEQKRQRAKAEEAYVKKYASGIKANPSASMNVANSMHMFVRSPQAGKGPLIKSDLLVSSVKKAPQLNVKQQARKVGDIETQKQIMWATTANQAFGDAGPLDFSRVVDTRRSAVHLTEIRSQLNQEVKKGTRPNTANNTNLQQNSQDNNCTPNQLVKTASVPLVHGNKNFHLMRYKQRAFSNYGTAKQTTTMAQKQNLRIMNADYDGSYNDNLSQHNNTVDYNSRTAANIDPVTGNEEIQRYWHRPSRYFPKNEKHTSTTKSLKSGKKAQKSWNPHQSFIYMGGPAQRDLYRESVQQAFIKTDNSILAKSAPSKKSGRADTKPLTKELLETRYNQFLTNNSQVRKKALQAHLDAKGKVPHKFSDASKRQYSQMVKYRRDMESNKITSQWKMSVYRPGLR